MQSNSSSSSTSSGSQQGSPVKRHAADPVPLKKSLARTDLTRDVASGPSFVDVSEEVNPPPIIVLYKNPLFTLSDLSCGDGHSNQEISVCEQGIQTIRRRYERPIFMQEEAAIIIRRYHSAPSILCRTEQSFERAPTLIRSKSSLQ